MKIAERPTECYIASFKKPLDEAYLQVNGFSRGMVMFSIPSHGILFKCRAEGSLLDLEFGAFFALLRFIKTSLPKAGIKSIMVRSSQPEFVFSVIHGGRQISDDTERSKLLEKYRQQFDLKVAYVPPLKNKTHVNPADHPSTPEGQTPPVRPRRQDSLKTRFRPIQKGVNL
jgi:hypothetical protein